MREDGGHVRERLTQQAELLDIGVVGVRRQVVARGGLLERDAHRLVRDARVAPRVLQSAGRSGGGVQV